MSTLHLLGTGSGLVNPARNASSYLFHGDSGDILFDCGEPVAATLATLGYNWHRLSAIVLSHTHADHLGGLPMLLQQIHLARRESPLVLIAPPEFAARVRDHLALFYLYSERLGFDLDVRKVAAEQAIRIDSVELLPVPTQHLAHFAEATAALDYPNACAAFAYRISQNGTDWFYSGDLGSFADIRAHLEGCRLAIVDSTHIGQAEVFAWAGAHPDTLVLLSHVSPHFDVAACLAEIARLALRNVRVAEDGVLLDLG